MQHEELNYCRDCGKVNTVALNPVSLGKSLTGFRVVCSLESGGCGASSHTYVDRDEAVQIWNGHAVSSN